MYAFGEQLAHYFNRVHTKSPDAPLGGAAAWSGRTLAGTDAWRVRLEPEHIRDSLRLDEAEVVEPASDQPKGVYWCTGHVFFPEEEPQ